MDEQHLRRMLRVPGWPGDRPRGRCPDEAGIAAFVEHRLSPRDEARVELHLADCSACLEQVSWLVQQAPGPASPVAPAVLARARDLVAERQSLWRAPVIRWGALAATAACVILAVSLQVRSPGVPGTPPSAPVAVAPSMPPPAQAAGAPTPKDTTRPPERRQAVAPPRLAVRNSPARPPHLAVVTPREGSTVSPGQLEIRWQGVPAAAYYEVHLVTEDGNVLWLGKATSTGVRPPPGVALEAGGKYFVWVRAYLSGGGTIKSAAVPFQVGRS